MSVEVLTRETLDSILREARHALATDSTSRGSRVEMFDLLAELRESLDLDGFTSGLEDVRLASEVELLLPRITDRITAQYNALRSQFELNAPWALAALESPLDLLSPMGKLRHEPTHTQILGYLLNPAQTHGMSVRALRELFALMGKIIPGEDTFDRLGIESAETINVLRKAQVRTEEVVNMSDCSVRCDLWIDLEYQDRTMTIVVENKIEALEHGDQLSAYEDAVWHHARQRRHMNFEAKLVFLTPDGRLPAQGYDQKLWIPLSYLQLAGALARASRDAPEPGRGFLNLYNASVLRMLGVPAHAEGVHRLGQLPYLNEFPEFGGKS